MREKYAEHADFYTIYIREAHPVDGWRMESNDRAGVAVPGLSLGVAVAQIRAGRSFGLRPDRNDEDRERPNAGSLFCFADDEIARKGRIVRAAHRDGPECCARASRRRSEVAHGTGVWQ